MEDYPPEMQHFVEQEGIEVLHYRTEGNKEPFIEVNPEDISHALVKLLDNRSHPGREKVIYANPFFFLFIYLSSVSAYSLSERKGKRLQFLSRKTRDSFNLNSIALVV